MQTCCCLPPEVAPPRPPLYTQALWLAQLCCAVQSPASHLRRWSCPRLSPAGLLLYAADLVLRAGQLANVTTVAAASVDDRSNTVTLQLKADKVRGLRRNFCFCDSTDFTPRDAREGRGLAPGCLGALSRVRAGVCCYAADLPRSSCTNLLSLERRVLLPACILPNPPGESQTTSNPQALGHCAPSEVWVQLPEVSRWQWHPFTVAGGGSSLLTLHIKRYGAFTQVTSVQRVVDVYGCLGRGLWCRFRCCSGHF